MTWPQVQLISAVSPWWGDCAFLRLSDEPVQVGGLAAVPPIAGLLLHPAQPDEIAKGTLHRGAGEGQVLRNRADGVPALPFPVGPVVKVQADCFGSGGQLPVPVDLVEKAHGIIPSVLCYSRSGRRYETPTPHSASAIESPEPAVVFLRN